MAQQLLCIVYPPTIVPFELKSGSIHQLPQFLSSTREYPHMNLKEFHIVYDGMHPQGVTEEQLNMRAFPFSQVCE